MMQKQDLVYRSGNFIKGKTGETIIVRLLRDLDFQVFHNGYQITHPALLAATKKERLDPAQIRKLWDRADLTILKETGEKTRSMFFEVEVKFRSNGKIETRELQKYDDDVRLILIDSKHFLDCRQKKTISGQISQQHEVDRIQQTRFA